MKVIVANRWPIRNRDKPPNNALAPDAEKAVPIRWRLVVLWGPRQRWWCATLSLLKSGASWDHNCCASGVISFDPTSQPTTSHNQYPFPIVPSLPSWTCVRYCIFLAYFFWISDGSTISSVFSFICFEPNLRTLLPMLCSRLWSARLRLKRLWVAWRGIFSSKARPIWVNRADPLQVMP